MISSLEDKFSGQIYFGKGVNLWRGFATYRFLIIVENHRLLLQYRAVFVRLLTRCVICSICKRFALSAIPFCNASLKYRNCTGPIGQLPAVKKEKAERDDLSSFSPKRLNLTSEVISPTAPVLNALSSRCFSCL